MFQARAPLRTITLRRLEVAAIFLPLAFLGVYYYLMLGPLHQFFHAWLGFVALWAGLTVPIWLFARTVFGAFRAMQAEITALHAKTERLNDRLLALHRVNTALSRETRYDQAMQRAVELARELLGAPFAALILPGRPERASTLVTATEEDHGLADELPEHVVQRIAEQCQAGSLVLTRPGDDGALDVPDWLRGGSLVCAPLRPSDANAGTICLASPASDAFDAVDAQVLEMFSTHAAIVIRNARLYEDIQALAVERERQQIAREMHDGLAQVLGFVNTKAEAVARFLERGDTGTARVQMAELAEAARKVYADIREGIVALRTQGGADGRGLDELVDEYVDEFQQFARLRVDVAWDLPPEALALSPMAEVQLLRIIQEALTNVRRHAHASTVQVRFANRDGALAVTVHDDGRGFDPQRIARGDWPQFGLRAMAERAEAAGGGLVVNSTPGIGTEVIATFPGAVRSGGSG